MNTTPKGFRKYDPSVDGSSSMSQYIIDDSTHNMDLVDRLLTENENKINQTETTLNEKVDNHTTLDGVSQSNLNFIGRDVVSDGLVDKVNLTHLDKTELETKTKFDTDSNNTIMFRCTINKLSSSNIAILLGQITKNGYPEQRFNISMNESKKINLFKNQGGTNSIVGVTSKTFKIGEVIEIILFKRKCKISMLVNGENVECITNDFWVDDFIRLNSYSNEYKADVSFDYFVSYNRILTSSEIQHNFQVLNNSPSIDTLEVTDTTVITSIPKLYKESISARGTLIEIPYSEPRDLTNYIYKFI